MIKSRTVQLIFQTAFCTIGVIAIFASIGLFDYSFSNNFYVYFTNLSNYLCIGIMFAELIQTIKRKEDGYVRLSPSLKFIGMLAILLTFLVFNILLAGADGRDTRLNFKVASISLHIVLPIMYVADWFLFYERKQIKWYDPLLSTIFPLIYVGFIFLRAAILKFDSINHFIYPYFFLNADTQGVGGVIKWIIILLVAFISVGYMFFGLDKLIKSPNEQE